MITAVTSLKHNSPVIYAIQNNTSSNENKALSTQTNAIDSFLKTQETNTSQINFGLKAPKAPKLSIIENLKGKLGKLREEVTNSADDDIIDDFWNWYKYNG